MTAVEFWYRECDVSARWTATKIASPWPGYSRILIGGGLDETDPRSTAPDDNVTSPPRHVRRAHRGRLEQQTWTSRAETGRCTVMARRCLQSKSPSILMGRSCDSCRARNLKWFGKPHASFCIVYHRASVATQKGSGAQRTVHGFCARQEDICSRDWRLTPTSNAIAKPS